MKSNIKNSTKKLLLLAAATVTAASAVAIATGSSYSVRASAAENNIVAYSNDVYEDIYYRSGQYEIDDSGPINQSCDVFLWNHMPDYSYFVANGYQKVTVTIKMAMKEKNKGYQQVFLYPRKDTAYGEYVQKIEVEYGGSKLNDHYSDVYFYFKSLPLSEFVTNDSLGLVIRYGATGAGEDTWFNKELTVTVTVSKGEIRDRNSVQGNVSFDDKLNNP